MRRGLDREKERGAGFAAGVSTVECSLSNSCAAVEGGGEDTADDGAGELSEQADTAAARELD